MHEVCYSVRTGLSQTLDYNFVLKIMDRMVIGNDEQLEIISKIQAVERFILTWDEKK